MPGLMPSTGPSGGLRSTAETYRRRQPHPVDMLRSMGRGGDTELGHLTPGEVVVPDSVLRQPGVRRGLMSGFRRAGRDWGQYEVGGMDDSRNPMTGMREYWDPGDQEGAQDPGFDGGTAADAGGFDGGPAETGFDFDQYSATEAAIDAYNDQLAGGAGTQAARTSSAAAMVGGLRDRGWSSKDIGDMLGVAPNQIGWADKAYGFKDDPVTKGLRSGLGMINPALGLAFRAGDYLSRMGVQRGWDIDYTNLAGEAPPGAGGNAMRHLDAVTTASDPATTPRGFYTPQPPAYLKYMESPDAS